ncbi:hypothetical protein H920_10057 [Fukomys damarensis]|uniref:Uncharacterized protein n=1 Tax=Fukomys damarensis TaxID=885580 RepID=A0A091DBQ4_FUKDA|nr:hypothetical protein H920_10057 [Fukomys damarensis]
MPVRLGCGEATSWTLESRRQHTAAPRCPLLTKSCLGIQAMVQDAEAKVAQPRAQITSPAPQRLDTVAGQCPGSLPVIEMLRGDSSAFRKPPPPKPPDPPEPPLAPPPNLLPPSPKHPPPPLLQAPAALTEARAELKRLKEELWPPPPSLRLLRLQQDRKTMCGSWWPVAAAAAAGAKLSPGRVAGPGVPSDHTSLPRLQEAWDSGCQMPQALRPLVAAQSGVCG